MVDRTLIRRVPGCAPDSAPISNSDLETDSAENKIPASTSTIAFVVAFDVPDIES